MTDPHNIISLKDAARRAGVTEVEIATTWAAHHRVEVLYDEISGKILGLDREAFEAAADPVGPYLRAELTGEAKQLRERERERTGQRGRTPDIAATVKRHLEGDMPSEGIDPGKQAIARAIHERDKARPPAWSIPQQAEEESPRQRGPAEAKDDLAALRRALERR
jgi:hypothetical protein